MDEFFIDSQKLMFHVDRLSKWLKGEATNPIYVEVSPTRLCNQRCSYCGLDFLGYTDTSLDSGLFKKAITDMAGAGVKAVMFGGEGEPLLYKGLSSIIALARKCGIDPALTTNGVLLSQGFIEKALPCLTWVKVSIDAGTEGTYSRLRGARKEDFSKAIKNLTSACRYRDRNRLKVSIGAQMILLPENAGEAATLARIARDAGADYLAVKSYSQHPRGISRKYMGIDYKALMRVSNELQGLSGNGFNVVFRANAMKRLNEKRQYKRCLSLPFWAYIDSEANLWACGAWIGDDRFLCGNLGQGSFKEIWTGRKRKGVLSFVEKGLDVGDCRQNCRMEAVNQFLWDLKNPGPHVNFI